MTTIQVTQELIDRLEHADTDCSSGLRSHFPCLIETAVQEATGQRRNFSIDGISWYAGISGTGYLTIDAAGVALLKAFDDHRRVTPGSFELIPL